METDQMIAGSSSCVPAVIHPAHVTAITRKPLTICLVGGIYDKDQQYREVVRMTPEILLESGLKAHGHRVITRGHRDRTDFAEADVIHVHHMGLGALRAGSLPSNAVFVYTSHDGPAMAGIANGLSRKLAARFVMSRADGVVALSEAEAEFQRTTYAVDGAAHAVIANGVDSHTFTCRRNRLRAGNGFWKLLYVGQLIEGKSVDVLLRAMRMLPSGASLDLVFHTDKLAMQLQKLAKDLGLAHRVNFVGAKTPEMLRDIYQAADLLVMPSSAECFPSVISEAMLCGTPIVSTDVGSIRDQLGGYGLLVPPGRADELAQGIRHVLDHYDEFEQKSESMSEYARRRFLLEAMVEGHLKFYHSLLEQKNSRRRRGLRRVPLNSAVQTTVKILCKTQ